MSLASLTDNDKLSSLIPLDVKGKVWLDLIEPKPVCVNTKCYAWNRSPYAQFNVDLENWKQSPSFRFTPCRTRLPFLCEAKTTKQEPCVTSKAEVNESRDESFPSNVKFNLGLDTTRLVRNIGLDQVGVDLSANSDYVIAIQA